MLNEELLELQKNVKIIHLQLKSRKHFVAIHLVLVPIKVE